MLLFFCSTFEGGQENDGLSIYGTKQINYLLCLKSNSSLPLVLKSILSIILLVLYSREKQNHQTCKKRKSQLMLTIISRTQYKIRMLQIQNLLVFWMEQQFTVLKFQVFEVKAYEVFVTALFFEIIYGGGRRLVLLFRHLMLTVILLAGLLEVWHGFWLNSPSEQRRTQKRQNIGLKTSCSRHESKMKLPQGWRKPSDTRSSG